jgi:hypothetical protein
MGNLELDKNHLGRQSAGIHIADSLTTGSQPQLYSEAEFSLNKSVWSLQFNFR